MEDGHGDVREAEGVDRWLNRPFASTFDLILSEYAGYTDELLLDVTLGRLHQMRDVIFERKKEDHRSLLELEEVKLRNLCTAVWGAAGSKDGVKAAGRIELFEREKKIVVASARDVQRMFAGG